MTRLVKYLSAFVLILGIACRPASAANLSKAQQEAIKTIKKTLGAKRIESLSNTHYRFLTKEGKWGVADGSANVLLAPEYDYVLYFPEFHGYTVNASMADSKGNKSTQTITLPTLPSAEALWGFSKDKGACVFNANGAPVTTFPNDGAIYFGNYLYLSSMPYAIVYEALAAKGIYDTPSVALNSLYRKDGYGHGNLVRSDGTVVIPDIDGGHFFANNPYLIYIKQSDQKVDFYGMKVVDGSTYEQAPDYQTEMVFNNKSVPITGDNKFISEIPPVFYYVDCQNGVWQVSDEPANRIMTTTVYEPGITGAAVIRDPGEAFYVRRQLDDVIAYYSGEGLDAPWASFYSASALVDKRYPSQFRFERVVEAMENGSGLPRNEQGVISDVNVIGQMLRTAISLYDQYINSGDTEFLQRARSNKSAAEYELENLNKYITRYNNVRDHAAMVSSQEEQQQAALMSYFLNSFSNILSSATSSSGKKAASSSYSTSGSAAVPASSGSSASGTDNSDRKAFLKGQIADWRNKLKKAEQSYEQAMGSGDDSWQKKKVLESKQHTIDECANMIRQYESELNSLK
ncbi:MAG: hypothetical protein K2M12_10120 [Muribaculaceae bacterium]|nr:hypothetical protein [Muribaculaceae bacterium]